MNEGGKTLAFYVSLNTLNFFHILSLGERGVNAALFLLQ